MPRRSSLTVPLIQQNNCHRRSRSADDRSATHVQTSATPAPKRSVVPGAYPPSSDDEENDDTRKFRVHHVAEVGQRPCPRTPEQRRPGLRDIASDPGNVSRIGLLGSHGRPQPKRQGQSLPCGRAPYKSPMGKCRQKHEMRCEECRKSREEEEDALNEQTRESEHDENAATEVATEPQRRQGNDGLDNVRRSTTSNEDTGAITPEPNNDKRHEQTKKQDCQVTAQIAHLGLIKEAKNNLTPKEEEGHIYIFRDPNHNGLLKIGRSKDAEQRGGQHKLRCGSVVGFVLVSNRVKNVKRAERLTQIDLKHLSRPWTCSKCFSRHGEWFEIEEEKAKEVVRKWTTWMNDHDPYRDGCLDPLWAYLMEWERVPNPEFEGYNHEDRWTHWNKVLLPISNEDRDKFDMHPSNLQQNRGKHSEGNRPAAAQNVGSSTTTCSSHCGGASRVAGPIPNTQCQNSNFYGPVYFTQSS